MYSSHYYPSKLQRAIALSAIFFLMAGQVVLPATMTLSAVQAAERHPAPKKSLTSSLTAGRSNKAGIGTAAPSWYLKRQKAEKADLVRRRTYMAQLPGDEGNHQPGDLIQPDDDFDGNVPADPQNNVPVQDLPNLTRKGAPSADNGDSIDQQVEVRALDLSHVPSEIELRRAGQLGGALVPLRPADPTELAERIDTLIKRYGVADGLNADLSTNTTEGKFLVLARKKLQRAQNINMSFGRAMQEWNKHNYVEAAQMFKDHIESYPESPWAGEAMLHLGCDAKYNGRFSEAQDYYSKLIDETSDTPAPRELRRWKRAQAPTTVQEAQTRTQNLRAQINQVVGNANNALDALDKVDDNTDLSFDIHQKAKLRWTDLDLAMGHFSDAEEKLADIVHTDTDWRRLTWASSWLRSSNFLSKNSGIMVACGPRSLADVLVSFNKKDAAQQIFKLKSPRPNGFNMAELQNLATRSGVPMQSIKVSLADLKNLPVPAILHYDFGFSPSKAEAPTRKKADSKLHTSPFQTASFKALGHFVVLKGVNAQARTVTIFDALEDRHYTLTYKQLAQEWSGNALVAKSAHPVRIAMADKNLTKKEAEDTVGGCCGVPRTDDDMGDSRNNLGCKDGTCGTDEGEPAVAINSATLNMYVHDTPIWYDTPVGPDVNFTLAYNSQDSISERSVVGNKWLFSYGSYPVVDTEAGGGRVIMVMPDGAQDVYIPNGSNYVAGRAGNFNVLTKPDVNRTQRYKLTFQDGSFWIYDIPAGTTGQQPYLIQMVDRWGYALSFGYDSTCKLTTITDAQGKVSTVEYNADNRISAVWDPFGRHAVFTYDAQGNLYSCCDVEGHTTYYTYDSAVYMTNISVAQGGWAFKHEKPDGMNNGSVIYPAPNGPMWDNSRLTVTNPVSDVEEYYYDGYHNKSWYVSQKNYIPYTSSTVNNYTNTNKTVFTYHRDSVSNLASAPDGQTALLTSVSYPDGSTSSYAYDTDVDLPTTITDRRGKVTTMTYNVQGQMTSVKDPKNNLTTYNYASNGLDLLNVVNANNVTSVTYANYTNHQPTLITDPQNGSQTITYTAWGEVSRVDNDHFQALQYGYNASGQLQTITSLYTGLPTQSSTQSTFTYDAVGRIRTATDASNLTVTYDYDNMDEVTKMTYSDGTSSEFLYVYGNMLGAMKDRSGRISYYDYDQLKRLSRMQDSASEAINYQYDKDGNLTRLLDDKMRPTTWVYDNMDQVSQKTYGYGATAHNETYNYVQGLLSSMTTTRGNTISYTYDDNGNVTYIGYPLPPGYPTTPKLDVSLTYDSLDSVKTASNFLGTITYNRNNYGRLNSLSGPLPNSLQSFSYDTQGRVYRHDIERGASGGLQYQAYGFDYLNRVTLLQSRAYDANGTQYTSAGAGDFTFTYRGNTGQLANLQLPNGTQTEQTYDSFSRLLTANNKANAGAIIDKYTYAYDTRDIRTGVTQERTGEPTRQIAYGYDKVDQLLSEVGSGGLAGTGYSRGYQFDASGNRKSAVAVDGVDRALPQLPDSTITQTSTNDQNQITGLDFSGNNIPSGYIGATYDNSGNLTRLDPTSGGRTACTYDAADRLINVIGYDASGTPSHQTSWTYDALGRKAIVQEFNYVSATSTWTKVSEIRRVFAGMDVMQERDSNNLVTADYVRNGNIGGILARTTGVASTTNPSASTHTYYGYDGNGNVTLLTDSTGTTVGKYRYDAFGNTLEATGTRAAENPFRFSTKELNGATGWYDYGYRFYSPGLGRWINRDPLGEEGGLNLYNFEGNSPTNNWDDYGLTFGVDEVLIAGSAAVGYASYRDNWNNGNYGWATVDALGVAWDTVSLFVPGDPGGAGYLIAGGRGAAVAMSAASTGVRSVRLVGASAVLAQRGGRIIEARAHVDTRPRDSNGRLYRTAERHIYKSEKEAREAAEKACKGGHKPFLDNGPHGPHYHPRDAAGKIGHDHYYFPGKAGFPKRRP